MVTTLNVLLLNLIGVVLHFNLSEVVGGSLRLKAGALSDGSGHAENEHGDLLFLSGLHSIVKIN
jgi:hypothetical protein